MTMVNESVTKYSEKEFSVQGHEIQSPRLPAALLAFAGTNGQPWCRGGYRLRPGHPIIAHIFIDHVPLNRCPALSPAVDVDH